jgi:hypothetical protein
MAKGNDIRNVTLFGAGVAVVACAVILGSVYIRTARAKDDEAPRSLRAFFNTVQAGKYGNAWAGVAAETRTHLSDSVFYARAAAHPAFRNIKSLNFKTEAQDSISARVSGTVSTGIKEFAVQAKVVRERRNFRVFSLSIDGTPVIP